MRSRRSAKQQKGDEKTSTVPGSVSFLLEELDFVAVNCDESLGEDFWLAQIREDIFLSASTVETDTIECTWLETKTDKVYSTSLTS